MPTSKKPKSLEHKLAHYQQIVDAIKLVMSLDSQNAQSNGHSILAQAVRLDNARVTRGRPMGSTNKKTQNKAQVTKNRRHTAALLKRLSPTEPRKVGPVAAPLLRHGYIKRSGDGYILTGKEFEVFPS